MVVDILITGSNGSLARDLLRFLPKLMKKEIIGFSHKELDITDKKQIEKLVAELKPKIIINCAALTNLDECQKDPKKAQLVNAGGPKNLAEVCNDNDIFLIQISTDYAVDPVNVYTKTKVKGEKPVLAIDGLVIRMTYYNHDNWLLRSFQIEKPIKAIKQHYFNPVSSLTLAETIIALIDKKATGLINVGTKDKINFYDFALAIADTLKKSRNLITPIRDLKWETPRPKDVFLETSRLQSFGIKVLTIEEDLKRFFKAKK